MQGLELESLTGQLIDGQEELLKALGVAKVDEHADGPRATGVVRLLNHHTQVDAQLRVARNEVLILASPGDLRRPLAEEVLRLSRDTLARGVPCRILLHPAARTDGLIGRCAERMLASGGEVRTVDAVFDPMVVVDHALVLILDDSGRGGALQVREPAVVKFLGRLASILWAGSEPFLPPAEPSSGPGTAAPAGPAPVQARAMIVSLLADGAPDKFIAKRLGISQRSVQAHVAELRDELGARSRFQLGYLMGRYGRPAAAGLAGPRAVSPLPDR